ncbi:MAG: OmpH family outer membrane protein [Desulfobacterales bacterium]
MRTCKVGFVATIICFCLIASSYGADVAKIGIVDFQRLFKISSAGKKAAAEIKKRHQDLEAGLKKKGEEIEAAKNKLEREALVMSREMREEREREIRIKINDIKSLEKRYRSEMRELEQRIVGQIQEEVLKIINEMGKKEGFLLILEKREAGVMYSPNTIDITDRLIQKYNASFARNAEKNKKTQKK